MLGHRGLAHGGALFRREFAHLMQIAKRPIDIPGRQAVSSRQSANTCREVFFRLAKPSQTNSQAGIAASRLRLRYVDAQTTRPDIPRLSSGSFAGHDPRRQIRRKSRGRCMVCDGTGRQLLGDGGLDEIGVHARVFGHRCRQLLGPNARVPAFGRAQHGRLYGSLQTRRRRGSYSDRSTQPVGRREAEPGYLGHQPIRIGGQDAWRVRAESLEQARSVAWVESVLG